MSDLAASPNLLLEIEKRQDEVLRLLDDLESKLSQTLSEYQAQHVPATRPADRQAA